MRALAFVLLLAASLSTASAQDAAIRIATETPAAFVVVDGVTLGPASQGLFVVEAGTRTVVLVEPSASWDARRAETTVGLADGDTLTVDLELPVRTRIESLPLHASVVLVREDGTEEDLGTTPLVVDRPDGLAGRLVARLDGHRDAEALAPAGGGRVALVLRPDDLAMGETFTHSLPTKRRNVSRTVLDLGLGALAVAAGAAAVHYKFKADEADDAYRLPGSSLRGTDALRNDALRYDTISGVALGVSTASLGVLAIRLAIR